MKPIKLWMATAVILCAACIFTSCSSEENLTPESESKEAFRNLLSSLNWGTDTCFVYGHKTPDVDAATSALSYAKLMRTLGYNCKAKVSSGTNRESQYIAGVFGFDLPQLKDSVAPQTRLILTDHSDYTQCVDGAREAIILQKIDHHVEGDIKDSGIPFVRREMIGSTNTIIYEMYKELGISIDDETARIMLAGIISDTRNLSKSITTGIDSTAWLDLTTQLGISPDSVARLNTGMENAAHDYTGMSDAEIFLSDYKEYEINSQMMGFASLDCKEAEMDGFIDRMLSVMPSIMQQKGFQLMFAKIDNLVPNTEDNSAVKPYTDNGFYFIYSGERAKAIAEEMFGPSLRDGVCYTTEDLSRKQIIPLITNILNR
ncbi:MAG: DHH family phosphoesterase [Bacteroidales bacterium]|nr:DHH family phosphoesterase [Bacteroidales bacterium]